MTNSFQQQRQHDHNNGHTTNFQHPCHRLQLFQTTISVHGNEVLQPFTDATKIFNQVYQFQIPYINLEQISVYHRIEECMNVFSQFVNSLCFYFIILFLTIKRI